MRYPVRSTAGMSWRVFEFISLCYLPCYSVVKELCRDDPAADFIRIM